MVWESTSQSSSMHKVFIEERLKEFLEGFRHGNYTKKRRMGFKPKR